MAQHDTDFLTWLVGETDRATEALHKAKKESPEWILALHRLEVLDECTRKYRGTQIVKLRGERRKKA